MGIYKAQVANSTLVRLEHLPEGSGETVEFRGNPVPSWILSNVKEGKHYLINLSFSDAEQYLAADKAAVEKAAKEVEAD